MSGSRTLRDGFVAAVGRFADREALRLGKESLTYAELDERARRIAASLRAHSPAGAGDESPSLTAVFGHRHPTAFASILGTLYRGHGYVPLNPAFPVDRSRAMLERSRCNALVVDATAIAKLPSLLEGVERTMLIIAPDLGADTAREDGPESEAVAELRAALRPHVLLSAEELTPADACVLQPVDPDTIAYLLFTSGSTGQPRGVMVAHRNVVSFVDVMVDRYGITEADRFSQTFDLTFDLSVFDMFCAWERGACLCVPTAGQKLFPGKYIKKHEITVWFSVPSTAVMMNKLRSLKPDSYPSLRWSLFCGEALPVDMTRRFAGAGPNAVVENLYGPTELTIACTLYRYLGDASDAESVRGVVPIGEPYPGMRALVVDDALQPVARGHAGELILAGPQVTLGYWEDPERTASAFVVPPGETDVFYRTGDRVSWPEGGPIVYLGRTDHQIKIKGYRIELGEVEAVLRDVASADVAIALPVPVGAPSADSLVGFVSVPREGAADEDALRAATNRRLPSYMQPSRVITVDSFPLNANGKVDRAALAADYISALESS